MICQFQVYLLCLRLSLDIESEKWLKHFSRLGILSGFIEEEEDNFVIKNIDIRRFVCVNMC